MMVLDRVQRLDSRPLSRKAPQAAHERATS
jgi:hypothetical protein